MFAKTLMAASLIATHTGFAARRSGTLRRGVTRQGGSRLALLTASGARDIPPAVCLLLVLACTTAVHSAGDKQLTDEQKAFLKERSKAVEQLNGLWKQERFQEALSLGESILEANRDVFGTDHEQTAAVLDYLSYKFYNNGKYTRANSMRREIKEINARMYGADHWRTKKAHWNQQDFAFTGGAGKKQLRSLESDAWRVHKEAKTQYDAGKYKESIATGRRALALFKQVYGDSGESVPPYADTLKHMSWAAKSTRAWDLAESAARQSGDIYRGWFSSQSPQYGGAMETLGDIAKDRRQYAQAERYYRQMLEIYRSANGNVHPDVAAGLRRLGQLYKFMDQLARAEELLRSSVDNFDQQDMRESAGCATSLKILGDVLHDRGQYDEAKQLFVEVEESYSKLFDRPTQAAAWLQHSFGNLHRSKKEYGEALRRYETFSQMLISLGMADTLDHAIATHEIALTQHRRGNYEDAERVYDLAIAIYSKSVGMKHSDARNTYNQFADTLQAIADRHVDAREYKAAQAKWQKARDLAVEVVGERHRDVTDLQVTIDLCDFLAAADDQQLAELAEADKAFADGFKLYKADKDVEAAQLYQKALRIRTRLLGAEHPFVAYLHASLGSAYYYAKDYEKAKQHAERAADIYRAVYDESSPSTVLFDVLRRLAVIYEAEKVYSKAAQYYRLAREAALKTNGEASKNYLDSSEALAKAYRLDTQYDQSAAVSRELLELIQRYQGRNLRYADALNSLGIVYSAQGDLANERKVLLEAMEICESLGKVERREYGAMTYNLGMIFCKEKDWKEAIEQFNRAQSVYAATNYSAAVAMCKGMAGWSHYKLGEYAVAEELLTEAIDAGSFYNDSFTGYRQSVWEAQLGLAKSEGRYRDAVATSRRMLADKIEREGDDHWSVLVARAWLKVYEQAASFDEDQLERLEEAGAELAKAKTLLHQNEHDQSIAAATSAMSICEELYGEESLVITSHLDTICANHLARRQYPHAREGAKKRLDVYGKHFGTSSPGCADAQRDYASTWYLASNYEQALPEYQRAAELYAADGAEEAEYGMAIARMGRCYFNLNQLQSALESFQRADRALRKHQLTQPAAYFNNRGNLLAYYLRMGDLKSAEQLADECLARAPRDFGEKSWEHKEALLDLAQVYLRTERVDQAEVLTRKAMELAEEISGKETLSYASALTSLAMLYRAKNDDVLAVPLFKQSLEIELGLLKGDHPRVAMSWRNLGVAYHCQGRLEEAEECYLKAFEIGETHRGIQPVNYRVLVRLYLQMGKEDEARRLSELEIAAYEERVAELSQSQTEQQQLAALQEARSALDHHLAVYQADDVQRESFEHVLRWKGGVFSRQQQLRLAAKHTAAVEDFRRWSRVTSGLATLALRPPYPDERELWNQRVSLLSSEKDQLELAMFRTVKAADGPRTNDLQSIEESLPEDAALVDFLQYHHWGAEGGKLASWVKFAAFIVRPGRDPVRVTLEDADEISAKIDHWRAALDWQKKAREDGVEGKELTERFLAAIKQQEKAARQLRELIWDKIEPHLDGVDTVLISPDAALGKLPFNALPGKRAGSYLFHDYAVAVVTVPGMIPDLVKRRLPREAVDPSLLLVGNVNYERQQGAAGVELAINKAALPFSFPKLEDDHLETGAVRGNFEGRYPDAQVQFLERFAATEDAFRRAASQHRWMHISTHGFFAPDVMEAAYSIVPQADLSEAADNVAATDGPPNYSIHEGLMSGLAFAHANEITEADEDDGILSATEVSTIDLNNTDLAVLSACQTALGTNISGEGVIGLQRAFQIAGARTTVTTLWSVETQSTRLLLDRFYRNLWNKDKNYTKLEAMREAQIWFLNAARARGERDENVQTLTADTSRLPAMYQAPQFWAAFVLSGDWE